MLTGSHDSPRLRRVGGADSSASDFWYAKNRSGSIADKEKRPRGRPRTGRDPAVTVRIPAQIGAAIAAWIELQPGPKPSRSEAIRRLIEEGLGSERRGK